METKTNCLLKQRTAAVDQTATKQINNYVALSHSDVMTLKTMWSTCGRSVRFIAYKSEKKFDVVSIIYSANGFETENVFKAH